jgi:hypothetical protein
MTTSALKPDMTVEERAGWYGYCHEASLAEMTFMVENMSAVCFEELRDARHAITKRGYLAEILRSDNLVYCRSHGNEPRILGGLFTESPGVGTVWAISTDKATIKDWIFITRGLNLLIESALKDSFHRVQAFSVEYKHKNHGWLTNKRLNMQQEAVLREHCKSGADLLMFSVLKGEL